MSTITTDESMKILDSFLKGNFYVNLKYEDPEISVYYNTISNDILTCIKANKKDDISKISLFSDYITVISDSNNRIDDQSEKIGLIYVDTSSKSLKDSIIIAKLPRLRETDSIKRQELSSQFSKISIVPPFWINKSKKDNLPNETSESNDKVLEKGKQLIETSIVNYCKKNDVPRENITNLDSFFDHLLPDIFKFKISVSDEQEIHNEINNFDNHYPEVFIQSLRKMGYLE